MGQRKKEQSIFKGSITKANIKREQHKILMRNYTSHRLKKHTQWVKNSSHSLITWQLHLEKHSIHGTKANAPGPSFIPSTCHSFFLVTLHCLHSLASTLAFIEFYKIRNTTSLTCWRLSGQGSLVSLGNIYFSEVLPLDHNGLLNILN